ncbi:MAG: GNAT family N-acetyltransferase [Theionarchaea archaeon]|nr:GNAT family N-acetyltransferase [Theionarchaea archaeon]
MVTIQFGISEDRKKKAAEIIYEALGTKLGPIFGSKEKGIPLFSQYLCNERIIVALENDTILGVMGIQYEGKDFIDVSFWQLLRAVKWKIFTFLFINLVYFSSVKSNEILVSVLAVDSSARGKGVGSALMTYIVDFARSHQCNRVFLYVVDTDKEAKVFYEKIGLIEEKARTLLFPWNRLFEFTIVYEMVYALKE